MRPALYYPFSRCLDDYTLKQGLLLYDKLLFVDPADPAERDRLFHGEIQDGGPEGAIAGQWMQRARDYRLLQQEDLIDFIAPLEHVEAEPALELLAEGIKIDLQTNKQFLPRPPKGHWSVLNSRLPAGALDELRDRFGKRLLGAKNVAGSSGRPTKVVRYHVGSSISLTWALTLAEKQHAHLYTDSSLHQSMAVRRFHATADRDHLGRISTGQHASAVKRRLIEEFVVDQLAPANVLRALDIEDVIQYRRDNAKARRQLAEWIDRLAADIYDNEWTDEFQRHVRALAADIRALAADTGRFQNAVRKGGAQLVVGSGPAVAGYGSVLMDVVKGSNAIIALGIGTLAAGGAGYTFLRELIAKRPPERNAVSYLLGPKTRKRRLEPWTGLPIN